MARRRAPSRPVEVRTLGYFARVIPLIEEPGSDAGFVPPIGFRIGNLSGKKPLPALSAGYPLDYSGIMPPIAYMPSAPLISMRVTVSPSAMSPII